MTWGGTGWTRGCCRGRREHRPCAGRVPVSTAGSCINAEPARAASIAICAACLVQLCKMFHWALSI